MVTNKWVYKDMDLIREGHSSIQEPTKVTMPIELMLKIHLNNSTSSSNTVLNKMMMTSNLRGKATTTNAKGASNTLFI